MREHSMLDIFVLTQTLNANTRALARVLGRRVAETAGRL